MTFSKKTTFWVDEKSLMSSVENPVGGFVWRESSHFLQRHVQAFASVSSNLLSTGGYHDIERKRYEMQLRIFVRGRVNNER